MDLKPLLVFLLLAFSIVAEASKSQDIGWDVSVGDIIGVDDEMVMDSESNRRTLAGHGRYISYAALGANRIPCGRRGRSYYNCQRRGRANPYRRGCSIITRCYRYTD